MSASMPFVLTYEGGKDTLITVLRAVSFGIKVSIVAFLSWVVWNLSMAWNTTQSMQAVILAFTGSQAQMDMNVYQGLVALEKAQVFSSMHFFVFMILSTMFASVIFITVCLEDLCQTHSRKAWSVLAIFALSLGWIGYAKYDNVSLIENANTFALAQRHTYPAKVLSVNTTHNQVVVSYNGIVHNVSITEKIKQFYEGQVVTVREDTWATQLTHQSKVFTFID